MTEITERQNFHHSDIRCALGIHKWESHSIFREGKEYTYNRCLRDCKRYGHWSLMDVRPSPYGNLIESEEDQPPKSHLRIIK